MKVTEQFISGISNVKKGDTLVLASPTKLLKLGHTNSFSFAYGNQIAILNNIHKTKKIPSFKVPPVYETTVLYTNLLFDAPDFAYVKRNIVGVCDLPATQDIIEQLKTGDKILIKYLKDNPFKFDYVHLTNLPNYNQAYELGKEVTVKKIIQIGDNKQGVVDKTGYIWFPQEIRKITYIKKNGKTTTKIG